MEQYICCEVWTLTGNHTTFGLIEFNRVFPIWVLDLAELDELD